MMDDELRGLERTALASGSPVDWRRFYERRARAGFPRNPSGVKYCKFEVGPNTEVLRIVCMGPAHTIGIAALDEVQKEWSHCQTSVPFSVKTVGAQGPFGDQEICFPWEETVRFEVTFEGNRLLGEGFMFQHAPFFGEHGGTIEISCPEFLEPHSAARVFRDPPGFARPVTARERAQLDQLRPPRAPTFVFQNPPAPAPSRLVEAIGDITPSFFPVYVEPEVNWNVTIDPRAARAAYLWSKAVPSGPSSPGTPPSAAPPASSPGPQPRLGGPATEPPPRSE